MLQANSGSKPPMPYRTGQATIYTVMLAIALVAIIVGCAFLFLEVQDYGSPPYPEGGVVQVLTLPQEFALQRPEPGCAVS